MYTAQSTALGKLRAYRKELINVYLVALRRRQYARARDVMELRRRVWRAILIREEWNETEAG